MIRSFLRNAFLFVFPITRSRRSRAITRSTDLYFLPQAKVLKPLVDNTSEDARRGVRVQIVLLIEDSKFIRITNQHILVKAGYNVIGGGDGYEALQHDGQCNADVILL